LRVVQGWGLFEQSPTHHAIFVATLTLSFLPLPASTLQFPASSTVRTHLRHLCASLPVLMLSFLWLPASSHQFPASRTVRMIYNQLYSLTVSSCRATLLYELDANRSFGLAPTMSGNLSGFISTFSSSLPESCDPAKSSLLSSSTGPCLHSTSFFSIPCGLFLHNGRPHPLCLQSLPDSFYRNGGVYPLHPRI
jgi:hypothetical protein